MRIMPAFNVMYSAMDNVGINYTVTNTDDSGINISDFGFRVYISERYIRLRDLDHIHGKIIG